MENLFEERGLDQRVASINRNQGSVGSLCSDIKLDIIYRANKDDRGELTTLRRSEIMNEGKKDTFAEHNQVGGGFSFRVDLLRKRRTFSEAGDFDSQEEKSEEEAIANEGTAYQDRNTFLSEMMVTSTPIVNQIQNGFEDADKNQLFKSLNHRVDIRNEDGESNRSNKNGTLFFSEKKIQLNSVNKVVKSIIKPTKFKTLKPAIIIQHDNINIHSDAGLPLSLFVDESDNKYLAVKRWEEEMKSLKTPHCSSSKNRSSKSVSFLASDDKEKTPTFGEAVIRLGVILPPTLSPSNYINKH